MSKASANGRAKITVKNDFETLENAAIFHFTSGRISNCKPKALEKNLVTGSLLEWNVGEFAKGDWFEAEFEFQGKLEGEWVEVKGTTREGKTTCFKRFV